MNRSTVSKYAVVLILLCGSFTPAQPPPAKPSGPPGATFAPVRVPIRGTPVEAELGEFTVPEVHAKPGGKTIHLRFLRFRSRNKKPGPPIVYLAGGPGASGMAAANGPRWALFDSLRDVADVILLDQRGTGRSGTLPRCTTGDLVPADQPTNRENFIKAFAKQVRHCRTFWSAEGVNLAAYNTRESAADLDALRRALEAEKLDLLAISYGTHLALAALKYHSSSFRRVVLVSPEGLDDSVKDPRSTDEFFARVQASINESPDAKKVYPDIVGMMRRVIARATVTPVEVPSAAVPAGRIVLGAFELQRMAGDRLADPAGTAAVLGAFAAADRGDWSTLGSWAQRQTGEPIFLSPMSLAMEAASGASPAKRDRVRQQAESATLGDALSFPILHAENTLNDLDLGDQFRAPFRSGHQALIVSGTLDGRTYPDQHRVVASTFAESGFISLINGGHNAALVTPEVQQRIKAFFLGHAVSAEPVMLPAPRWIASQRNESNVSGSGQSFFDRERKDIFR